jgi:L-aspartate oxidase
MRGLQRLDGRPVIVGAGIAGLMTALHLAPRPSVLVSAAPLGENASSVLAQGGVAVSLGADDSPQLHLADTLAAGAGLCDVASAGRIVEAGPAAILALIRLGVRFDCDAAGAPLLGLEAAHGRRRIAHAEGDATGRAITSALIAAVRRTPCIEVLEGFAARRLLTADNRITGISLVSANGPLDLATSSVVLATGGIGGLFEETTNPPGCFGQGLALAARAGAVLADLEFIQFHPTALATNSRPMKLISEAVRGEGAILINQRGERLMADVPGAELAPRDIVARAVWREITRGGRVFLDARAALGEGFAKRFPGIAAICRAQGIDPATQLIPVRPAAHYHMGGIAVDAEGRSSVAGLWACGEVANTGLHGANRLASNSLLEAIVCAQWVARSVDNSCHSRERGNPDFGRHGSRGSDWIPAFAGMTYSGVSVRRIVSRAAGVMRDEHAFTEAADALLPLAMGREASSDPAIVALMVVISALRREESRGAHYRTDFPDLAIEALRSRTTLNNAIAAAQALAPSLPRARRA